MISSDLKMERCTRANFSKSIFSLVCGLLALIAVYNCVFLFLKDEDIASIDYPNFHSTPLHLYPSLSLCFGNILDEEKLIDYKISKKEYLNFLRGRPEYWNESWIDINFEDVSIDLMEHLAGAEVCKEKTNGEISSDPYFLYDNTILSKEDNGQKWIPALTVSSDPRYNLIQKCLTLDVSYLEREHLTWITLIMRKSVFQDIHRPKATDYMDSFSVNIHYPNQRLHFSRSKHLWNDAEPKMSYGMLFDVFGMEVVESRNKGAALCGNDWKKDDLNFKSMLSNKVGCVPPYGNGAGNGQDQSCQRADQLKQLYELELDNYVLPCRKLTQVSLSYSEFLTNYYSNGSVLQNLTEDNFYVSLRFSDHRNKEKLLIPC